MRSRVPTSVTRAARIALVTASVTASVTFALASAMPSPAHAYCPSYTPAQTSGGSRCGVQPAPGKNPTVAAWKGIFATVAPGQASWKTSGPAIGVIGSGCGKPKPRVEVPAHFPCHVLQAIAYQESGWQQFCVPDAPSGSVGAPERTIVSFDCGYGVGQVTSGMHVGEAPKFDRARVASDATYNLATGTLILAAKWLATACVGDNDPDLVEHWYTALWAYNGLAYSNNPNNPNLTAGRGVYNPANGGSYTYQERVLGLMEHPSAGRWVALAPAYPNRGEVGGTGEPPALPEPVCASPTSCTARRSTHTSSCEAPAADAGAPAPDASSPRPDASAPTDAEPAAPAPSGVAPGAGVEPGATAPPAPGCACHVGARDLSGGASLALLVLGLALGAARRRRRPRA